MWVLTTLWIVAALLGVAPLIRGGRHSEYGGDMDGLVHYLFGMVLLVTSAGSALGNLIWWLG